MMRRTAVGIWGIVALSMLLAACSSAPTGRAPPTTGEQYAVRLALYDQYGEWRGVPYRLGGLSKGGVDCSGLVHLTFRDRFGIQLPRTTADLAREGMDVRPRDRQSGDLVFFRINRRLNHVGIYMENGRFLHASTSSGVMISSLADPYWQQRYWKTVRPRQSLLAAR